ncbi:hypothetical protein C1J03_00090 [Sulfitobacter sp. SK012]|uniref:hypothetical protein n=1 Tax=Sulfitobacter sp. SK012 TaxID=1389005 RepID=UPI000E0BBC42|nr:hypothetical protein [Sulfitobacter sp. SK012]AXI44568.1 hypothetical protein C1J03_00090 [Sulfitobacter sp. SK012]
MVWAAASKLLSKLTGNKEGKGRVGDGLMKKKLNHADTGIPIGREDQPAPYSRWKAQNNDAFFADDVDLPDGATLQWREYLWNGPTSIDECEWGAVRWRFYSNGLVCFDAKMSNTSGRVDPGDVQGHRIELREKNGLLLGVWVSGVFVKKSLPQRSFAASFMDQHELLKLHFSDLDDNQNGAWVCL